jgi:hypothetical protein
MTLYFGHSEPITDAFDIETQYLIKNKPPLIRSQILTRRIWEKKRALMRMVGEEINKRMREENARKPA